MCVCVCTRCIFAALYLIHLAVLATAASAANTNSGVIHVGTCCAEKYAMILLQLLCPCLYVYVCVCVPQLQLKWCQLAAAVNEPIDLPPAPVPAHVLLGQAFHLALYSPAKLNTKQKQNGNESKSCLQLAAAA